jgi:hypothetical protein
MATPVPFLGSVGPMPDETPGAPGVVNLKSVLLARGHATVEAIPAISMPPEQLRNLDLDHRGGYVLSLIDGRLSVRDLIDVSDLPKADTSSLLAELLTAGALTLLAGT